MNLYRIRTASACEECEAHTKEPAPAAYELRLRVRRTDVATYLCADCLESLALACDKALEETEP